MKKEIPVRYLRRKVSFWSSGNGASKQEGIRKRRSERRTQKVARLQITMRADRKLRYKYRAGDSVCRVPFHTIGYKWLTKTFGQAKRVPTPAKMCLRPAFSVGNQKSDFGPDRTFLRIRRARNLQTLADNDLKVQTFTIIELDETFADRLIADIKLRETAPRRSNPVNWFDVPAQFTGQFLRIRRSSAIQCKLPFEGIPSRSPQTGLLGRFRVFTPAGKLGEG